MENKPLKQQNDNTGLIIVSILSALFIFTVLIWTYKAFNEADLTTRGTFGDMFGAANALFSGLAFVGIIVTILLQRKELSLQREELIETRKELERSASAQEKSERALNRQAENLKISAKLSALNTLVNYYSDEWVRISKSTMRTGMTEAKQRKLQHIATIEEILEMKDNTLSQEEDELGF